MIDGSHKPLHTAMGLRLKDVRKAKKLTLKNVSSLSGVSIATLSKMENHQASPSFDIIKRICDGLEIPIEEFVRSEKIQHGTGRKTATRIGEGVLFTSGQYDYTAHATDLVRKGMVPLEIRIRARSVDEFDHWSRHRGEEFVYVLSGAIEVYTEFYSPIRLNAGESAYFDSSMAHVYISVGKEDARVLSISYDPDQGRGIAVFLHPSAQAVQDAEENSAPGRAVAPE